MTLISPDYRSAMIVQALVQARIPCTNENCQAVDLIISHESGWNPVAVNLTDSNAKAGHPSVGLMQIIPSTFAAHALPGENINNPIDNMAASIRYAVSRYKNLASVPGVKAVQAGKNYVGY